MTENQKFLVATKDKEEDKMKPSKNKNNTSYYLNKDINGFFTLTPMVHTTQIVF